MKKKKRKMKQKNEKILGILLFFVASSLKTYVT